MKKVIKNKIGIESPETLTNDSIDKSPEGVKPEEEKVTKTLEEKGIEADATETDKGLEAGLGSKLKKHYGFDDDMSDDDLMDKMKEYKNDHEDLMADHEMIKGKLDTLAKEAKIAHKTKIDAMVNDLISAGKIGKEERDNVIKLANADFEATKNIFSKINITKAVSISKVINNTVSGDASKATWTIRDYEKKAPKDLMKIKNESPETYKIMFKDFYGVEPK